MKTYRFYIILSLFLTYLSGCTPPAGYVRSGYHLSSKRSNIVKTAKRYLGVNYKYGGMDPRGFDCSGLTSYVYRRNNFKIPRTASGQFSAGRRVAIRRARPGDLVFFKTSGSRISHVGIYIGNYRFIHSPRTGKKVSYEDIRKNYWRSRYAGVVTYFR